MIEPLLLRVVEGPEEFADLMALLRRAGLRVGWLDLTIDAMVPPELDEAAANGAMRAVAAKSGRVVSVKRLKGAAVLNDLLREHFLGCRLVLVRGSLPLPRLLPRRGNWRVETLSGGKNLELSDEAMVETLRRSRPFE